MCVEVPISAHNAGNDVPFVNNYGVWVDEFRDLGLEKNLNRIWQDALCYFGEGKEVRIGRQYGRVCRRKLRKHLLQRCQDNGVQFLAGIMNELETEQTSDTATIRLADGQVVRSRYVFAIPFHNQQIPSYLVLSVAQDMCMLKTCTRMHMQWQSFLCIRLVSNTLISPLSISRVMTGIAVMMLLTDMQIATLSMGDSCYVCHLQLHLIIM